MGEDIVAGMKGGGAKEEGINTSGEPRYGLKARDAALAVKDARCRLGR